MNRIQQAIADLEEARNAHDDAVTAQGKTFDRSTCEECPKAVEAANNAIDAVKTAELTLLAIEPENAMDALRKIAALLEEGFAPEGVATLKAEAARFTGALGPLAEPRTERDANH